MKILHVITCMDPKMGGVCQALRTMISGLTLQEVENEVVCLDDPDAAFLTQDKFKINALGRGKGPWCYHENLLPWLIANLTSYDIVIIHGLWQYPGFAVNKAKNLLSKQGVDLCPKIFVMPHGMLDPYFQRAPDRRLKALRNIVYWKLIESKLINGADGLFFTCEEESLLASQSFSPYLPKRKFIVGIGVESPPPYAAAMKEEFLDKCPGLGNSPYILFLSRIHQKKGIDLLIDAYDNELIKIIRENSKREFPKLVIAGPGLDTPFGNKIQQMVFTNKALRNSIFFTDMLTGNAKWGAFYGCEAFILPSHQENFGIAVVEALACSKPVLISNQVNIWREIYDEKAGYVASDSLAGTIELLVGWNRSSQELKSMMSKNAIDAYLSSFNTMPATTRLLEAIIESYD